MAESLLHTCGGRQDASRRARMRWRPLLLLRLQSCRGDEAVAQLLRRRRLVPFLPAAAQRHVDQLVHQLAVLLQEFPGAAAVEDW